jgi:hypothetical protein
MGINDVKYDILVDVPTKENPDHEKQCLKLKFVFRAYMTG